MAKSEIRKDYLLGRYVIITPSRAKRPRDIKEETIVSRTSPCPFCPEKRDKKNILDTLAASKDRIVSLKNIYPAVSTDNEQAYGVQEVIIETDNHIKELADLSEEHIAQILKMYARRTEIISQDKRIEYILCFKNQGSKAGASIVHAHSQIFATDVLPPDLIEELTAAQNYKIKHHACAFCDIINKETKSPRKIFKDKYVAAFAPFASQYHYEAWIFTRRHLDNITRLNTDEFKSFAKALKIILTKLKKLDLSFNFFLHQAISNQDQHFYLKIQPRDSVWAGVELGSGLIINSVPPEEAAAFYRK